MEWFGLWCDENNAWAQTSAGGLVWGPREVVEAFWRSMPAEIGVMVEIRRFGREGQPEDTRVLGITGLVS